MTMACCLPCSAQGPCGRAVGADGGGEGREGAAHFGTNAAGGERMGFWFGKMAYNSCSFRIGPEFVAVLIYFDIVDSTFRLKKKVRR